MICRAKYVSIDLTMLIMWMRRKLICRAEYVSID